MRKYLFIGLFLSCTITPTLAQQPQDDPEYLKHAIAVLQIQRNNALDSQAVAEAKLAQVNEQLKQAQLKVKGLEDKLSEAKPDK